MRRNILILYHEGSCFATKLKLTILPAQPEVYLQIKCVNNYTLYFILFSIEFTNSSGLIYDNIKNEIIDIIRAIIKYDTIQGDFAVKYSSSQFATLRGFFIKYNSNDEGFPV